MIAALRDTEKDTIRVTAFCGCCSIYLKRITECTSFYVPKEEWPEGGQPSDNIKRQIENAVWQKKWTHIQMSSPNKGLVDSLACMRCIKKAYRGDFQHL